mgnify:CR=1 FL=1
MVNIVSNYLGSKFVFSNENLLHQSEDLIWFVENILDPIVTHRSKQLDWSGSRIMPHMVLETMKTVKKTAR